MSGLSFRTIADDLKISVGKSYEAYFEVLERLPPIIDITRNYCNRFCGILLVDGKYVKVKGYDRKIPVIYGIDYLTHDIVHFVFGPSENYSLLLKFFSSLKLANYPLQAIISDDNQNTPQACLKVYPTAIWQLCQNHYKHNLRTTLNLNNDPTHRPFMNEIETLFEGKLSPEDFKSRASKIYKKYAETDELCKKIMLDIAKRSGDLGLYKDASCSKNKQFNRKLQLTSSRKIKNYQRFSKL